MGKYQKCQHYNQPSTFWGRSWKRGGKWWLQDPWGNLLFQGVTQIFNQYGNQISNHSQKKKKSIFEFGFWNSAIGTSIADQQI